MYIPAYAAVQDRATLVEFLREHSFGTLVGSDLSANHYPFLVTEEGGELFLWTHLARKNRQWEVLDGGECLAVFTGPHGYISPAHYVNPLNVPTWNYTAVHARGAVTLVREPEVAQRRMRELVSLHEARAGTSWDYRLPEEFHRQLFAAIVWLRIRVTALDGKFKLSQNRKREDYDALIAALARDGKKEELLRYMGPTNPFQN
jgi:transcriptional regulator